MKAISPCMHVSHLLATAVVLSASLAAGAQGLPAKGSSAILEASDHLSKAATGTIDKGVIKVGSDLTYPPYNYLADGKRPAGFDVELMTALGKAIHMRVEFQDIRFEKLIPGVQEAKFDVIASTLYAKMEREMLIDFIPYMRTGISIAVLASSGLNFKAPKELCGRKVGSIKGAGWLEKLAALNKVECSQRPIQIHELPTSPEVTQALLAGTIDAQLEDSAVLQDAISKLDGRVKISSTDNFYPVVVVFGVRKGNSELTDLIRKGLRRLQANGCYNELLKKYNLSKPRLAEFYMPLEDPALAQARTRPGASACDS